MAARLTKRDNPFHYGRELGAEDLVDREDETTAVIETISQGEKLFLIGPRRYGKTSILKAASDQAEAAGAAILRFDVEAYPTLDLLARAMLSEATGKLTSGRGKAGQKIKSFFSSLKPEVTYSLTEQTWSASLGVANEIEAAGQVPLLVDLLNGVEKLAAEAGRPVGVILDEFQKVIKIGGRAAEGQVRAAIQRHKHVGYVFAGSKTRLLTEMTSDASRPFYRLGARRYIGPVPRRQFADFLRRRFEQSGIAASEAEVDLILDLAEEVPYNVQMLAHFCWNKIQSSGQTKLSARLVEQQRELIIRQDDPFYSKLWNQLSPNQQKALLAVIKEKGIGLLAKRVVRESGMATSTLQRATQALIERDILREDEVEGAIRYRFEDPFFAGWIALILSIKL
ncbi:MAG: AAA family ATPase [Blastocatellia bacterium]